MNKERRRPGKSDVKVQRLPMEVPKKRSGKSGGEAGEITRVAVKGVDIRRNTSGEGRLLDRK